MKFHKQIWDSILQNPVLWIIGVTVIIRVLYLFVNFPLWWDSHVYIGMGKYIFSGGEKGIWEVFRPLVHPIVIGFLWKMKLDPVFFGKLMDLIFSTLSVYFVYLIGKKVCNVKIGILSGLLFAVTPLFLIFTGLILTEPLAIFFSLVGTYLFILEKKGKEKFFTIFGAGLCFGLTFMTKFPQGIFFGVAGLILLFRKENILNKIKNIILLVVGFLIPVIPFLLFNYYKYGNISDPFTSGSWIVTTATWLYGSGITYYFTHFFLLNPIYILFFVYIYYFIKEKSLRTEGNVFLLAVCVLTIAYFTYVPRKEVRYLVTITPLLAILVVYTIKRIYLKLKSKKIPLLKASSFLIICIILTVVTIPESFGSDKIPSFGFEVREILKEKQIEGVVLGSNPDIVSYVNNDVVLLSSMEYSPIIYENNKGKYELLVINDCDFICHSEDKECITKREELIKDISVENTILFSEQFIINKKNKELRRTCTYSVSVPK